MTAPRRQGGFTIVSAIFILVVLSALAAFVAVISTTAQIGSALDVQGARAYQAARAGIEWGTYQVWRSNPSCRMGTEPYCGAAAAAACPASPASFALAAPTLAGFVVTVHCTATADAAANGPGPTVFRIEAWACNQPAAGWGAGTDACPGSVGNVGYVERYVSATL